MRRLIYGLLAVAMLAAVGCEKEVPYEDQYYVLYFCATVVNESGEPIQGILAYPEGGEFVGRTGYSNYQGVVEGRAYLTPRSRWVVVFEDVDAEANGGEYRTITEDITDMFVKPSKPDDNGYTGSCIVNIGKITLNLQTM